MQVRASRLRGPEVWDTMRLPVSTGATGSRGSIVMTGWVRSLVVLACAGVIACTPVMSARAEPVSVTLVHVNDWDRMDGIKGRGGAARIATVVREERARAGAAGHRAIVTFGGDMTSPSLLSAVDKGAHMIALANAIGFDFAVPGNHEFDFGPEILAQRLAESNATWLAGNVTWRGRPGFPGTRPSGMIEHGGYRIGFLGITTPETARISAPGTEVSFAPVITSAAALAAGLRDAGADVVVALTHNHVEQDRELLREVPAIDVVLGGHDHLVLAMHDGRQTILKAGSQGIHVGILRLEIDRKEDGRGGSRLVLKQGYELRLTKEVDPDLVDAVDALRRQLDQGLDTVLGQTSTELDSRRASVRSGEAAIGNLVADAMRMAVGSDVALTNGGGIRGDTVYPAGTPLTRRIVLTELPFGNKTVKLAVTGAQLRSALENGVAGIEDGRGAFPQVSGLTFSFDARRPKGERVVDVTVGGKPLDEAADYTLATNDFLAKGGDGYAVLEGAERLIPARDGTLLATRVMEHVTAAGTVSPALEGRIIRLD